MGKQHLHRLQNFFKLAKSRLKPYVRYVILGGTFVFIAKAFFTHWREVANIQIRAESFPLLAIALGITLLSLIFVGWVWMLILREFGQYVNARWAIQVFLKTNIAKYLPGNIWHFWGRILEAKKAGISSKFATLSVLLEPLLMASAGVLIGLICFDKFNGFLRIVGSAAILTAIHPRILNPIVLFVERLKLSKKNGENAKVEEVAGDRPISRLESSSNLAKNTSGVKSPREINLPIKRYPLVPLIGQICFIGLRGCGFLLTVMALNPVNSIDIPNLFGAFCLAFVVGLVVPGAPGGMGVFEATAIALLSDRFSVAIILSAVALYRIISILADVSGAALAKIDRQRDRHSK
ncbi:MAG: lysylphosphatidylglycerol synthase domain-containing protein [Microcoleus sp.]|uniref:lysylphosphatidylglycerol synthase transmembrane domain-containing protein n=1 Tax=Microcoleus sp. TaxID=44472 RepID=UPI003C757BA6